MNKTVVTIALLALALIAGWWLMPKDAGTQQQPEQHNEPAAHSAPEVTTDYPTVAQPANPSTQPTALERAQAAKANAERELERLDEELEQVEAYIAELEASGLNPVDYSEEGMEKMQPILAAYLDVEVKLAAADAAIEEALAESQKE